MSDTDQLTSEVLEIQGADGSARYPSVTTMTDLVHMLNDGQFNADCASKLHDFSTAMEDIGVDTGKKVKGKITLTIEVEREHDGVYFFTPQVKLALPAENHGRTIGWVTDDNRFTPNKPRQGNLFGTVRDVTTTREVR